MMLGVKVNCHRKLKLAQDDMPAILEALGRWEADGTWEVANAAS
jgi:hypothetical protein